MGDSGRRPASVSRSALFVATVVAGTLLGTAIVGADSVNHKSVIGTAHGLTYVQSKATLPSSNQASAIAKCPKHTAVSGGGAFVSGDPESFHAFLNSSSPEPAGGTQVTPDKGWIAYAASTAGADEQTLRTYAICSRHTSKLKYRHETVTLPGNGSRQASAIAKCPKHTAVSGGGAFVSGDPNAGDAWLNSSSPEPAGGTQDPDKGWIAYAVNDGGTTQTLHVYVICSADTSKITYRHEAVTLPNSGSYEASATAKCPKHTAVSGGGAFVSGDPDAAAAWLNSSSPEPAGGAQAPDKGWIAYAVNIGGASQTLHVYAICMK